MTQFLPIALAIYVLATTLGLLIRFAVLVPMPWLPIAHAIHAHSHTLYFGWLGLAILVLAFQLVEEAGRFHRILFGTIAVLSVCAFGTFLHGGYAGPSIVVSTLFLFVWAVAVVRWWRAARGRSGLAFSYLRVAMAYLVIASLGAWARVVVLAMKVADPLPGKLAVFAFLLNFAWFFVFAVVGLLVAWAPKLGLRFDERLLRRHLAFAAPIAWVTFPLGVVGGAEFGLLGAVARWAALLLIIPGGLLAWALWKAARGAPARLGGAVGWLALWYALKTAMEAAGAFGLSDRAVAARHPAILYLHVFLLGFVTLALLLPVLHELGRAPGRLVFFHCGGIVVLAVGLVILGGPTFGITAFGPWLMTGFRLAAFGGVLSYLAGWGWAWPRRGAATR